ncbi:FkbM family methyltransferase [Azohydromonas lata]|uniref:FkbM family methyltransferase n=1 Tax=Azohydromonas lata TaxID=45677 RepID=UPI00082C3C5D|nr:FkbM family methyltransferase [Azohydromonas lata]
MHLNHFVQVDLDGPGSGPGRGPGRFWMDSCGGRDPVAMAVLDGGWRAYVAPLPALVAAWSRALRPVFVDVGASTGFYSLLALAAGAVRAHAFEPVAEIADVLAHNARMSELQAALRLHRVALGDEAGRATLEQALAHEPAGTPMLLRLDAASHEPQVLRGAAALLRRHRPAVVCELLPDAGLAFFEHWCQAQDYAHYALDGGLPGARAAMGLSLGHRAHLFLPNEAAQPWLAALSPRDFS